MCLFAVYYSCVAMRDFSYLANHSSALKTNLDEVFGFVGWLESILRRLNDRVKVYVLVAVLNAFLKRAW